MPEKKTKADTKVPVTKPKTTKKKTKEPELINLDETVLLLARELFKKISVLDLEVNEHYNRKTLIISESELNSSLNISMKLSEFKEVRNLDFKLLDNDEIEITLDIEKYSSSAKVKRQVKIDKAVLNHEEGCFTFNIQQESNKVEEIICKVLLFLSVYILKHIFTQDFVKNLHVEKVTCENNIFKNDLKEGSLSHLYHKTINQIFNTKVPYFGDRKITEMIEIEGIMCEKGQMWVHFVFKVL